MPYENFNFGVKLRQPDSKWLNPDPRPGGWYADFDEAEEYGGWDGIMGYLSQGGWEVC